MRPIWSGAISFGLIHIPVKLYSAVSESSLDLDMLRKQDLCPIRYARVCRDTGEEVPWEDIVKGYEYRKGDYVILEDEDFKRANVAKTQTIDVVDFVNAAEVDPVYLEKPYYLEPAKEARKAYALLREALKRTGKAGLALFVLRNRQHLALLKPEGDLLILNQMRFASEIRKPEGLNLPTEAEASRKELDMAIKLIEQLSEPFRPEEFHDTYREELERVIEEKARGKTPKSRGEAPVPTAVPDLMAKLRESLSGQKEENRVSLKEYRYKRTFSQTPEPTGERATTGQENLSFVVHKHQASHLHFDLRLELDGVLKSWAVPKGPSMNPKDKRLAMMVEDHPLDYRTFEGVIPEGNYGAGTVMIWDQGTYHAEDAANRRESERLLRPGLGKGHIRFVLNGRRLNGAFSLVKIRTREENAWLLIKKDDRFAYGGGGTEETSVATGRTMEEIAKGLPDLPDLKDAPLGPMPGRVKPMLATLTDKPFNRDGWFFEIKWDGYRMIAEVQSRKVHLYTRNNQTMNEDFPLVVESLSSLPFDALFDGELVVVDEAGRASFQLLQNYMRTGQGTLVYYVFDLLYLDGHDLCTFPLGQRKKILKQILPAFSNVKLSDHVENNGVDLFEAATKNGIEGIIAKNALSPYRPGIRGSDWIKIKTYLQQEAVIAGFTQPRGGRKGFGALVLGVYSNDALVYIGHAGGGFTDKELTSLLPRLEQIVTDKSPFEHPPKTNMPVTWVEPRMVCEVRFTEWTDEGLMRQPVFLGLREDLDTKEVRREEPQELDAIRDTADPEIFTKGGAPEPTSSSLDAQALNRTSGPLPGSGHQAEIHRLRPQEGTARKTHGITLVNDRRVNVTNRDKVFWPDTGYTKGDLIDYYRHVAPFILPYLKDRPEALNRHPDGIEGESFFQKNLDHDLPSWARTVKIRSESEERDINYLLCNDAATLVYMANLGCIEINPWHSRVGSLEKPDYLVLDIDPLNVPFDYVVKAALGTYRVLRELDVPCFCKTSGATGLHVYVPLAGRYDYDQVRNFAQLLNALVHERLPDITSMERNPRKRERKVYLDFLQNRLGQTLAAPYCIRPRKGATASTPLHWDEVDKQLRPEIFTMKTLPERLSKIGDIWQGVLGPGVDMEACLDLL